VAGTESGRGQDAAKRLLGSELEGVLVTDQYARYRFIDSGQRQLCWAHVLRNVAEIAGSGEQVNQPIGARLVLLANSAFRVRHGYDHGVLRREQYLRRLERCRNRWRRQLGLGPWPLPIAAQGR
jgi:transposase